MSAARAVLAASDDAISRISQFAAGYSLEATLPSAADIDGIVGIAPAGTQVFLSAVPTKPLLSEIEPAGRLRRAGFEPVPHIAARNFPSESALDEFLTRMTGEAAVRKVLVIAGDRDDAAGPYQDALAVIHSGVLERHGIRDIGISGYPDGHPRISEAARAAAFADKLAAAAHAALDAEVVSQFAFEAAPIESWVTAVRESGVTNRIRIGLAGPAGFTALMRYARKCGVKASARGATRNTSLFKQMFSGLSAPDDVISSLANPAAEGSLGEVGLHFFSFGGLVATAQWANAVAEGRIRLTSDGFDIA